MAQALSNAQRRTLVRSAIQAAEKAAPGKKDDRAFLEALRARALAELPAPEARGGARSLGLGPKPAKGARLADDPRYLKNARALAERTKKNARILGGNAVTSKEFHDCVAVGDDQGWGCTGTLIQPRVVLTAGHCMQLHSRVFVGNDVDKPGRIYRVARHVRHSGWDGQLNNDVMLLVLEKPVAGVKPRKLATAKLINAATDGRVVGFGTTDVTGTVGYGVKQQTDVPIVSAACRGKVGAKADSAVYGCHLGKELVAGKPMLNRDTCRGDSGGPLYVADAKGKWLLAGVTSRGTDLATSMCGDGGVYTRVDAYRKWVSTAAK